VDAVRLLSIATASSSWARCRTAADGQETLPELALSDEGREVLHAAPSIGEIGRSILTTPGLPPDRLAALRTAFQAMLKEKATIRSNRVVAQDRDG
jgi:hypothetical protein